MSKTYRPWNPSQSYLFPPSPRDWLPEDDLVYFLLDVTQTLDLTGIFWSYEAEARGFPPYHPRMMLTLLFYAYSLGVFGSRRIQTRCERDVAFRMIVGNDIPDFRTISDFRKRHLPEFQRLFVETVQLCREAGLVKLGRLALDGTKIKANASRHKAMSYKRMLEEERRLKGEIAELLAQAEAVDTAEDQEHGRDRRGDELPAELARRASRLERIAEAKRALEERARTEAREAGEDPKKAQPEPTSQYNFTDPETRLMKVANKGFDQCGNAQAVVDGAHQVIVACAVTNECNDKQQWEPMVEQAKENLACGWKGLGAVIGDNGYYSEENVRWSQEKRLDAYLATGKVKHNARPVPAPRGRPPKGLSIKEQMQRKLATLRGRTIYAQRKWIVEPVFGQTKRGRGFTQFLLNGMEKMEAEWALVCLTHNLLKFWRHAWAASG